jgi:hypothetical protein
MSDGRPIFELKFSPGPWTYTRNDLNGWNIKSGKYEVVAPQVTLEENAFLISLAPELYYDLQDLVAHMERMQVMTMHTAFIRAKTLVQKVAYGQPGLEKHKLL